MNISKINHNQSFGKHALMTCRVKESVNQTPYNATLFQLDAKSKDDRKDVFYSKQTRCIARDFLRAQCNPLSNREFFLLQNDETGEVISCAQTSHRYRPFTLSHSGQYTLIEEADENNKYVNGHEPLFAFITKRAFEKYDKSVFTAFDEEAVAGLKRSKFSKTKTGEYYLPEKRFSTMVNQAEKRYQMQYLG